MMGRLNTFLKKKDVASVGIGTMIIFIGMILVAAVAATVLIDTSYSLQSQAKKTGRDTIDEVSIGVRVMDICGQYGTRVIGSTSYTGIHNLTITITPRAGARDIDLSETLLIITNGTTQHVLQTNSTLPVFANSSDNSSVFSKTTQSHSDLSTVFDLPADEFGIIVVTDYDNTCTETMPGINKGDKVMLTVNITALFNFLPERTKVWGRIVPEEGAPGIFDFETPKCLIDTIIDLY
jgi:flagellin FlaB